MVDLDVNSEVIKADQWAFEAGYTYAGVTTTSDIIGAELEKISAQGRDLIIKGLTLSYFKAGGGVTLSPRVWVQSVNAADAIVLYLDDFTTTAALYRKAYYPLDIAVSLYPDRPVIRVLVTTAALDVIRLSAWGGFVPTPEQPKPIPVDVLSVRLFKARAGGEI